MSGNGNGKWTLWVAGIMATLILSILGFMGKGVVANNENSISRDDRLNIRATANEVKITKLEACQKAIEDNLGDIKHQNEKIQLKLDKILTKVEYQ